MSDDTPTRPENPRSKSSEFAVDARIVRAEGEIRVALAPGGSGQIPATTGEDLLAALGSFRGLVKRLIVAVDTCGRCERPATRIYIAAKWCDMHAPSEATDLPSAGAIRRAERC